MTKERLKQELSTLVSGMVALDEPMSMHTSMGVGGKADVYCVPADREELRAIVSLLAVKGVPFMPMGNGTNLIVRDGGYRGVVISLSGLGRMETGEERSESVLLNADAGVSLSRLVEHAASRSLSGMEFCAGIPGSVGGALKMNAGAYGREMKDIAETVIVVDGRGDLRVLKAADCVFQYRNLSLEEGMIVAGASFCLVRGDGEKIKAAIDDIHGLRRIKHPLRYRSAGSIFKNPPHMPAGRIIEELGLKGLSVGDALVSEEHGNFIVNRGRATASDVTELIFCVAKEVHDKTGICLEPEVKIVGEEQ